VNVLIGNEAYAAAAAAHTWLRARRITMMHWGFDFIWRMYDDFGTNDRQFKPN